MIKTLATLPLWLALAACAPTTPLPERLAHVQPAAETEPVETRGDAADDPAIWLHPQDPAKSRVLGTQKQDGLYVYDLHGRVIQFLEAGAVNNVDLRYGFSMADGSTIDLVAATNRSFNGVELFRIDETGLTDVAAARERTDLVQVYGICMGRRPADGSHYVYANSKDGAIRQYRARATEAGTVALERVRDLKLESQVEGCVVDDATGTLFVGEERRGVWRFDAWPDGSDEPVLIARVGENGLAADVEGLAIAHLAAGGYLVVSSQGNDTYAVYDLLPAHDYRGSFRLVYGRNEQGRAVDGTSSTDGIEILTSAMGRFGNGLMVVQDGLNTRPAEHQNFKYVDWSDVAAALGLAVHPDYDPRTD